MRGLAQFRSEFLQESYARGFIHQCTDVEALDNLLDKEIVPAYLGFDATATSLHVGNLVGIMWLRLLQRTGHKPIVLLGGGTTKIGDPSGKDTQRQLLTDEQIAKNIEGIQAVYERYLRFGSAPKDAILVNNATWLESLNYIDFLRDYGRHFSINRMLSFDSVKIRLEREQPLSFLEFNYMIFQAYDFVHLFQKHGCLLQMGGSDQWGNIINGVELVRRCLNKAAYGLTAPLITTSSGAKMGKTAQGAVWLNADKLSPYDYWQFWRNTDDSDVVKYLKLFTDLPLGEIERLGSLRGAEINEAKKILADEATHLAHGREVLEGIHLQVRELFESQGSGNLANLPNQTLEKDSLPMWADDFFANLGLCASKGEARRLIQGGGARLNDVVVEDIKQTIDISLFSKGPVKVSAGKKKHIIVSYSCN